MTIQPFELIPSNLIKQEIENDSYMDNEYVNVENFFFSICIIQLIYSNTNLVNSKNLTTYIFFCSPRSYHNIQCNISLFNLNINL